MISEARNRSGWSVTWSSGKYGAPSGKCFQISLSKASQPEPFSAETGTMAAKSKAFANDSVTGSNLGFGKRSILFSARMVLPLHHPGTEQNRSLAKAQVTPSDGIVREGFRF